MEGVQSDTWYCLWVSEVDSTVFFFFVLVSWAMIALPADDLTVTHLLWRYWKTTHRFLFPQLCKAMDIIIYILKPMFGFFYTIPFRRGIYIYYMKTDIMKITNNDMDIASTLNLSLIPYRVEKDCRLGTLVSPFSTHLKRA